MAYDSPKYQRGRSLWAIHRLLLGDLDLLEDLIVELDKQDITLIPTIDLPHCQFAADAAMRGSSRLNTAARGCPDVQTLVASIRANIPLLKERAAQEKAKHDALMAFYFKAASIEGLVNNSAGMSKEELRSRLVEGALEIARMVLPAQQAMGACENRPKGPPQRVEP